MSPALDRGLRKLGRSVLQVIAGGGAGAITDLVANAIGTGLGPEARVIWSFAWYCFFVFAQNLLETQGTIPTLLPAPGLITESPGRIVTRTVGTVQEAVGKTVGTVAATVDETGHLAGDVVDTAGDVVGGITGTVGGVVGEVGGLLGDDEERSTPGGAE